MFEERDPEESSTRARKERAVGYISCRSARACLLRRTGARYLQCVIKAADPSHGDEPALVFDKELTGGEVERVPMV